MEQGESLTSTIPENSGTSGPRISSGQVLSLKPHRSGSRVQSLTGLFQTPCPSSSLAYQVLRQRGTAQSTLPRGRQWNRQDIPHHGIIARDAVGRLQERGPCHSRDPERVRCLL